MASNALKIAFWDLVLSFLTMSTFHQYLNIDYSSYI